MSCERARPLLYDLIDREIGRDDAVWLAEHLASCPACAASLVQLRAAEELYVRQMPAEPPPDLAARVADAVWSGREVPRARQREWAAVSFGLLALSAAVLVFVPGAAETLRQGVDRGRELLEIPPDAGIAALFEQFAAAWRDLFSSLPAPPRVGWAPVAAVAAALQILGSARLLARGGRTQRERAR